MNFYSHDIYQPFFSESFTLCAILEFSTLLALSSSWNVLITTFLSLSRSSLLKQTKCTIPRALDEEAVEKRNIEQKYMYKAHWEERKTILWKFISRTHSETLYRGTSTSNIDKSSRASQPVLLVWMFTLHRSNYNWIKCFVQRAHGAFRPVSAKTTLETRTSTLRRAVWFFFLMILMSERNDFQLGCVISIFLDLYYFNAF